MNDIYAIRRANLLRVLAMPQLAELPNKTARADALGVSSSMFSQLIRPTYRIGDDKARDIEARMGLPLNWMDNPEESSQPVTWDIPKLSEALVSVDKAVRRLGLKLDLAFVAEALEAAYLQRLRHPDTLDRAAYTFYDDLVYERLKGAKAEDERRTGGSLGAGAVKHEKAGASRQKAGHRES